ncbi:site-specific integrase [Pisciglobus halotolerans]|nr:site-specific integrase [Pisciglobus halotolerans]
MMSKKSEELFHEYFIEWVEMYKYGAVRSITLRKYYVTHKKIVELAPKLALSELNRRSYQKLLNDYALTHEKQTTMDFHHQLKGAILDALDEKLISRDPTRKVVIKGKQPGNKKPKFLNQFELHALLNQLELTEKVTWDWLILLIAKTGLRFSEALAITPEDFDFSRQLLTISKTWNYKSVNGGFQPTKNQSSKRKVPIDWQTVMQFSQLVKKLPSNKPIFIKSRVFNSTVNSCLSKHCKNASIPIISIHGLRHTHASLLLFAGVSIASVARRLGHSNMTTTQQTYLHVIHELENQDNDKIMRHLATLY